MDILYHLDFIESVTEAPRGGSFLNASLKHVHI